MSIVKVGVFFINSVGLKIEIFKQNWYKVGLLVKVSKSASYANFSSPNKPSYGTYR